MSSFLQHASSRRSALRPAVVGALTCGALMVPAGAAQASDQASNNGMLCREAGGMLGPGESPAAPTVERAASSAPIGAAATRTAPVAARPAPKPAVKAPVQRPAVQQQVQRPAQTQAQAPAQTQAQRPAAATRSAASNVRASAPAQRQVRVAVPAAHQATVARPSVAHRPRAAAHRHSAAKQPITRPAAGPVVMADVTLDAASAIQRPTASPATPTAADSAVSTATAMLAALLGLTGIVVGGLIAMRRRVVRARRTAPLPTLAETREAAIEAELQEIIVQTRARALRAPALSDESDDAELSQRR